MQDDEFGRLPQGSYKGVVFAVLEIAMSTGARVVFHEFPHRPGQRAEYLGRRATTGTIFAAMFNTLQHQPGGGQNRQWPDGLQLLRERVQEPKSGPLVVPTYGTFPRAVVHLDERYTGTARNGAFVVLHFAEDLGDVLAKGTLSVQGRLPQLASDAANELGAAKLKLRLAIEDAESRATNDGDLRSAIDSLRDSLKQLDEDVARPIRQAEAIVDSIDELLSTAASLSDPTNWKARDALLDLRDATSRVTQEALSSARSLTTFLTNTPTTAVAVAAATRNALEDVLRLNVNVDPHDIAEGEILLVYENA